MPDRPVPMVKALVAVAVTVVEPPNETLLPLIVIALLTRPVLGKPVALVSTAEEGVPRAGVTRVGLVANTNAPVPVSSVTTVRKLSEDGVARNVATPVPRPEIPVDTGSPVALVNVALDGVPKAGVTSVGLVANTKAPVPVSSVTAARKLAELGVPKNVATPAPKAVRPVPPEAAASGVASVRLDRWSFWKLKLVPSDQTVTVLPAGMATPKPAAVVLPRTVELKIVAAYALAL